MKRRNKAVNDNKGNKQKVFDKNHDTDDEYL